MSFTTLRDVLTFAIKNAESHTDRYDLITMLDALENTGAADIKPGSDIIESWGTEFVDEVIAQTDDSLFEELAEEHKIDILHKAYARYSKTGVALIDAVSQELQNFTVFDEGRSI